MIVGRGETINLMIQKEIKEYPIETIIFFINLNNNKKFI